jgi:hypothetical protein
MLVKITLLFLVFFYTVCQTYGQSGNESDSTRLANTRQRIFAMDSLIRCEEEKQVGNLKQSDLGNSLPIGMVRMIGGIKYIICIDSARFGPQGASFDVYMAAEFPGSNGKLAFQAKNVPFNPKGVRNGGAKPTRLKLVGDQKIKLGPNMHMVFNADSNFVQWDCEGYAGMGIDADIFFSKRIMVDAIDTSKQVVTNFHIPLVEDLKTIVVSVSINRPFMVPKLSGFKFTATNLTLDRSETANPFGAQIPNSVLSTYDTPNNWMGFYASVIAITLPESWSKNTSATTIGASHLVIDDGGVSGDFFATNIFSSSEASMSDWAYSLDSVRLSLIAGNVVGAGFGGMVSIPQLNDAAIKYHAGITHLPQQPDYSFDFTLSPAATMVYNLPCFNSTVVLYPTTSFGVTYVNNRFKPSAKLNGLFTVNNPKLRLNSLGFSNIALVSHAPYILGGTFALTAVDTSSAGNGTSAGDESQTAHQVAGLKLSLDALSIGVNNNVVLIHAQVSLCLGGEKLEGSTNNSNSFGVSTGINIFSKLEVANGRTKIVYDRFSVDNIAINVNTSPFWLNGIIALRNDDPVFGDLFYGSIQFQLNKLMKNGPALFSVGFGKISGKKYWFVDAGVPVNIQMGSVTITNLYGGVRYRVQSELTNLQMLDKAFARVPSVVVPTIPFVPNLTLGLGFRAGVALMAAKESAFNAEAMLDVQFNANGGFLSINFDGRARMLVSRANINGGSSAKVLATLSVAYNHETKVFNAALNGLLTMPNYLNGSVNITMHVDSNDWYFYLNRPSNRAIVEVVNLFNANFYFEVGTIIDPLPPPPAAVINALGSSYSPIAVNASLLGQGDGFLVGAAISAGFSGEFPHNTNWRGFISIGIGAGFDMTMVRLNPGAHCSGEGPAGVNGWYCSGQVYAWLNGALGARRYSNDGELRQEYSIASINAAALLQGRLPKPTLVNGAVGFQVSLLNIINFGFDADISFGNDCAIIN